MNNDLNNVNETVKNKVRFSIKFDKKLIKILLILFVIIFVISFGFSAINIFDFSKKIHSSDAVVVSATDNTSGKYKYDIEFYDHNNNFCSSTITTNRELEVDDYVRVYYNNPNKLYLERSNPSIVIVSIVSLIIIVFLLIILKHKPKPVEDKETKRLLKANNIVYAKIDNIVRKDSNQVKYYNIICKWTDPNEGREYTFVSEDLDFDPTMSIRVSNKNSLNVYLDKNDYNKYIVDVSDIKNNRI